MDDVKACRVCLELKPRTAFYAHVGMRDGLVTRCKACAQAYAKRYREQHPEQIRKYSAAYRLRDEVKKRRRLKARKPRGTDEILPR